MTFLGGDDKKEWTWSQISSLIFGCFASTTIGQVFGFSAILLPQLDQEYIIDSKSEHASWIGSMSVIGCIIASPFISIINTQFGRRSSMLCLSIALIFGWSFCIIAHFQTDSQSVFLFLVVGRFLQGVGIMSAVTQVYLVEIAPSNKKATYGSAGVVSVSFGITFVYTLGAILPSWFHVATICLIWCGVVFLCIIFHLVPETPPWLITNQRYEEARKAIILLNCCDDVKSPVDLNNVDNLLEELELMKEEKNDHRRHHSSSNVRVGGGVNDVKIENNVKKVSFEVSHHSKPTSHVQKLFSEFHFLLSEPEAFKPFLVIVALFILQQLSGTFAVTFFAVDMFKHIITNHNDTLKPQGDDADERGAYIATILVGVVRLIGSLIGSLLLIYIDKKSSSNGDERHKNFLNRKSLLILSSVLMCIPLILASTILFLTSTTSNADSSLTSYIVMSLIIIYIIGFGLGLGTIPWVLVGQLCPARVKGLTSGFAILAAYTSMFVVVKGFSYVFYSIGAIHTFSFFALVSLVTGLFSMTFVPAD